ncbi:MAG: hypothetical protein JWM57_1202 [Phycisphaerales bacterium]|nr:hypothetical protein [Phycisphaerales bacterium]
MKHRRGFMFIDAIVALGLLTSVAMLLVVARSGMTRVTRQADDHRAAVRAAERVLIEAALPNASTSNASPATQPAVETSIADLPTPAPAGWKWVSVRATVNGHAAELSGLVRRPS